VTAPKKPRAQAVVKSEAQPAIITKLQQAEVLEAIERLGFMTDACKVCNINRRDLLRARDADPVFAAKVEEATRRGREVRQEFLESLAYSMAPTTPVMVMFLLKKLDPTYRESYNVHSTTGPNDYVIDLTADDPTPITDVTPKSVLGK
jgi:hypothetical protein